MRLSRRHNIHSQELSPRGEVASVLSPLFSDFKSNFCDLPLAFVFNKIKVAV
jgi:hypothetical protein